MNKGVKFLTACILAVSSALQVSAQGPKGEALSNLTAGGAQGAAVNPLANGRRVVAYYQNYKGVEIKDIDGNKITHLVYTFLKFNDDLNVVDGDKWLDKEKFFDGDDKTCTCCARGNYHQLYKFRQKYPHVRVILSIGGWIHSKYLSKALLTPEGRQKTVKDITSIMRDYGLDGVDIDWEFPVVGGVEGGTKDPKDGENLIDTLRLFREHWKQYESERTFELSVAVAALKQDFLVGQAAAEFSKLVDFFMVMAYEFQVRSFYLQCTLKDTHPHIVITVSK
jgi:chitinase